MTTTNIARLVDRILDEAPQHHPQLWLADEDEAVYAEARLYETDLTPGDFKRLLTALGF